MGLRVSSLLLALSLDVCAQTSHIFIETIAGAATFDNRPAKETPIIQPQAVWVHPNGDLFISDGNFVVRRVRNGMSTIVAGGGSVIDNSLPIPGKSASLDYPNGLAGTVTGDLYISDVHRNRIERLNADGTLVTVVGKGTAGFSGDGGISDATMQAIVDLRVQTLGLPKPASLDQLRDFAPLREVQKELKLH